MACGIVLGIAGTIMWSRLQLSLSGTLCIGSLLLLVWAAAGRRARYLLVVACLLGGVLGAYRGSSLWLEAQPLGKLYGQTVILEGVLSEDASRGKAGELQLQLGRIRVRNIVVPATAWVSTATRLDIKRGDIVRVEGLLREGFGSTVASMFRARVISVKRPQPGDIARRVRDAFAEQIRAEIPEPQSSLGIGYLTGQKSALPPDLNEQLQITGLTHAVVASGYNLTILVGFAQRMFLKQSKYLSAVTAGAMIAAFMGVTGFSPSMSRAGLVAGLTLFAWYYGRSIRPVVLLPVAAAITALYNPYYVKGDLGWYLSFAAFAGVIILAPSLIGYFWGDKKPPALGQLIVETCAAQAVTLPIILWSFGQFASYALVANLLVVPLVPMAMAATFLTGLAAALIPFGAVVVAAPAILILRYMTEVISYIAALPGSLVDFRFNTALLIASYLILIMLSIYLRRSCQAAEKSGTW